MQNGQPLFRKYLFVCENQRPDGVCCAPQGVVLRDLLKRSIKERRLDKIVRVSRTGCLDVCREGPNVLLMPDNIWFKHVGEKDIEEIIRKAAEGVDP